MVIFDIPKTKFTQRYEFEIEKIKIRYTGEWRKGVAIGYGSNPMSYQDIPYLISKDKILYRGNNDYYHVDEIYRTSEGDYLVFGYRDCSAPGKDSDYRGPFLKCVISEDGKTKISPYKMINGDIDTGWYDSNNKKVFVPKEMASSSLIILSIDLMTMRNYLKYHRNSKSKASLNTDYAFFPSQRIIVISSLRSKIIRP